MDDTGNRWIELVSGEDIEEHTTKIILVFLDHKIIVENE